MPCRIHEFWLSDAQFERIKPHLPTDTRGVPRVDDRRVISGIVHVIKSGGRWVDAPASYGPRKTLYNRFVVGREGVWTDLFTASPRGVVTSTGPQSMAGRARAPLSHLEAKGELSQAVGASGAGDRQDPRPTDAAPAYRVRSPAGTVVDCRAGEVLLTRLNEGPGPARGQGHDSNAIRRQVEAKGTLPNIPPRRTAAQAGLLGRSRPRPQSNRTHVLSLKDFRRIATRYDRKAINFLAAVCIARTVSCWL